MDQVDKAVASFAVFAVILFTLSCVGGCWITRHYDLEAAKAGLHRRTVDVHTGFFPEQEEVRQ